MKCIHCGQECFGEEQTCKNCGKNIGENYYFDEIDFVFDDTAESIRMPEVRDEEVNLEQFQKHSHKRVYLIIGAISLLLGILAVIFVRRQSDQNHGLSYVPFSSKRIEPLSIKVDDNENILLLRFDGKAVQTIESEQIYIQASSLSRELVAFTTGSDERLYVVNDQDQILLDYNVESVLVSQDGSSVAYIKDVTKDIGELHLYHVNTNTSIRLALDVSNDNYVLSPDGDSIAYVKITEGGLKKELYVSIDGKEPKKFDSGQIPFAISNHGKFLYVYGENGFQLIMNLKTIQLGNEFSTANGGIIFNRDLSQVIYSDGGTSYISVEGKITKIGDRAIYKLVMPPNASYDWNNTGTTTLTNHIVQTEDGLYFLDDHYQLQYICESSGMWQVAKNQESLLLYQDNELFLFTGFQAKNINKKKIVEDSIAIFKADLDLSIIYYLNKEQELYSIKEDGKPIMIADQAYFYIYYNYYDGYCYYATVSTYGSDYNIYYSVNQESGKKVKNFEGGMLGDGILVEPYPGNDYIDLYAVKNGVAKLILSKVNNN